MANQALAQKILDTIELNETVFEMANWFTFEGEDTVWGDRAKQLVQIAKEDVDNPVCGTTMCLAGHAAVESGYALRSDKTVYGVVAHKDSEIILWPEANSLRAGLRTYTDFDAMGADLLDIPRNWAEQLFRSENDTAIHILELLASGDDFDWEEALYSDNVEDFDEDDA